MGFSIKNSQWKVLLVWLLGAALSVFLLGFEARPYGKILVMAVFAHFLWVQLKSVSMFRPRALVWVRRLAYAWFFVYGVHLGVLSFLNQSYGGFPDEVMIVQAVSNTNFQESAEFFSQNPFLLIRTIAYALLMIGVSIWSFNRLTFKFKRRSAQKTLLAVTGLLFVALHFNPTSRLQNPFFFWWQKVSGFKKQLQVLGNIENSLKAAALQVPEWQAQYAGPEQMTVVLVIGESLNRDNMHLYGYARETTPELDKAKVQVFKQAFSGAASTQPAVEQLLTTATAKNPRPEPREPDVLMLAKSVGYKVFWLTNQKDVYLRASFASQADELHELNKVEGRSSVSFDEVLIPAWQKALQDNAAKKLIVIHMIGQHPHYDLRYPDSFNYFGQSGQDDAVEQELSAKGIGWWGRAQRNHYDNAVRYTDAMLGQLLRDIQARNNRARMMFVSDHGQEVMHTKDYAGHSPKTDSGYTVPLLFWQSAQDQAQLNSIAYNQTVHTDDLNWALLDFLDIKTPKMQAEQNLFAPEFKTRPFTIAPTQP